MVCSVGYSIPASAEVARGIDHASLPIYIWQQSTWLARAVFYINLKCKLCEPIIKLLQSEFGIRFLSLNRYVSTKYSNNSENCIFRTCCLLSLLAMGIIDALMHALFVSTEATWHYDFLLNIRISYYICHKKILWTYSSMDLLTKCTIPEPYHEYRVFWQNTIIRQQPQIGHNQHVHCRPNVAKDTFRNLQDRLWTFYIELCQPSKNKFSKLTK
jgi:hypothetical protein